MSQQTPLQKRVFWSYVAISTATSILYVLTAPASDGNAKSVFGYFSLLANVTTVLSLPYLLYSLAKDKPLN